MDLLDILYRDEFFIAINKPPGYVVHRSSMVRNAEDVVLQTLRNQLDQWVYPVHRLDRKTSGVLVLGLDKESCSKLSRLFQNNEVDKKYKVTELFEDPNKAQWKGRFPPFNVHDEENVKYFENKYFTTKLRSTHMM